MEAIPLCEACRSGNHRKCVSRLDLCEASQAACGCPVCWPQEVTR